MASAFSAAVVPSLVGLVGSGTPPSLCAFSSFFLDDMMLDRVGVYIATGRSSTGGPGPFSSTTETISEYYV